MAETELNSLVDDFLNIFLEMENDQKINTFKLGMIEVYKKILEMAENEKDATQFFINVISIVCSLNVKDFNQSTYNDVICSLSGDSIGFKQFYKSMIAFDKDKSSIVSHIKVLHELDDDTKNELLKATGCVLTYGVNEVKSEVKEKFLNFMIAIRT